MVRQSRLPIGLRFSDVDGNLSVPAGRTLFNLYTKYPDVPSEFGNTKNDWQIERRFGDVFFGGFKCPYSIIRLESLPFPLVLHINGI